MYLKIRLFIVLEATAVFILLSPAVCQVPEQSRALGNYFSSYRVAEKRQRDGKDMSEWPYGYFDEQRAKYMNQFRAPDGDHPPPMLKMQKPPHGLGKNEGFDELLLDRGVPSDFDEYVHDDYNDADFLRGMFNVYLPNGRPQNVNFEKKILKQSQF